MKTRKGRSAPRPLDSKNTMHLVLKSSKAQGEWSFWKPRNKEIIRLVIKKFSKKYGIKVFSTANVGNHLHLQIKLSSIHTYKPFIRAITSAIATAITGTNRWNPLKKQAKDRFWDLRPFTRVAIGYRAFLTLTDYININRLEGFGFPRNHARFFLASLEFKSSGSG